MRVRWLPVLAVLALFNAAGSPAVAAGQGLTGHYYLNGLHEVGSELLLEPGGHYRWFLSYGASDTDSEGSWRQVGDHVVLTATPRAPGKLFTLKSIAPWSDKAQAAVRKMQLADAFDRSRTLCPFDGESTAVTTSPALISAPAGSVDASTERAARDAAVAKAAREAPLLWQEVGQSRATIDRSLAHFLAQKPGTMAWHAAAEKVRNAIDDFNQRYYQAADRYRDAGLEPPAMPHIVLPAVCAVPDRDRFQPTSEPYVGLHLTEAASGIEADGISARFDDASGASSPLVPIADGWAVVPLRAGMAITAVSIVGDPASIGTMTIAVQVTTPGVIPITFDAAQIAPRMFETLDLVIAGDTLSSQRFAPGIYERGR